MPMEQYIERIAVHSVGNKANGDAILLSSSELLPDESIRNLLATYFLSPFKSEEYYNLYHESSLELNEAYNFVSRIFDDPQALHEQSVQLAKHLYEQSNHPKIKGGEFYVVYFTDCPLHGETVDAVGLFKSENKDTFLKISASAAGFEIESQQGININRLDKGCLIYDTDRENGYVVAVVDNTNKGTEARYWLDDFLHVRQRQDNYHHTENAISMCKNFVTQQLPQQFDVTKADQADLLNRSAKFFKEKETFDMQEFANEVMAQPEVIDSFNSFCSDYQQERDIRIEDNFEISNTAVKKQSRFMKSVIKLDRNFHIYVHGNNQYIRKGYDEETGMNYYQLLFNEEQ